MLIVDARPISGASKTRSGRGPRAAMPGPIGHFRVRGTICCARWMPPSSPVWSSCRLGGKAAQRLTGVRCPYAQAITLLAAELPWSQRFLASMGNLEAGFLRFGCIILRKAPNIRSRQVI